MDNIIQVIVFFIIIYAVLSPLFNKKKPVKENRRQSQDYGVDAVPTQTSRRTTNYDVLEDFLGFKIPKTGDDYIPNPSPKKNENYDLQTIDYDTDLKVDYKNLETETKMPDIDYDNLPAVDKILPQIEQVFLGSAVISQSNLNEKALSLKNKFNDKLELRDLILITEIFNKPKALRR